MKFKPQASTIGALLASYIATLLLDQFNVDVAPSVVALIAAVFTGVMVYLAGFFNDQGWLPDELYDTFAPFDDPISAAEDAADEVRE